MQALAAVVFLLSAAVPCAGQEVVKGVLWGGRGPYYEAQARECLETLRATPWNEETEALLAEHPFVVAAEDGSLSFEQLRRFAGEQRHVQASDAASFAALAGSDWRPPPGGITDVHKTAPPPAEGLFGVLLAGELEAAPKNQRMCVASGLDLDARGLGDDGRPFVPSHRAQAYAAFWAKLAFDNNRAAAAAAAAVNFPAWGRACGRVHKGVLASRRLKKEFAAHGVADPEDAVAFLAHFATDAEGPIAAIDDLAVAVMAEEFAKSHHGEVACDAVAEPVRLLQAYELDFWDAVFDEAHDDQE